MTYMTELANKYGKPDMERLGLFIEMPYMNGKGYVSPFPKPKVTKGRNIMCEGRKLKNGTQHGYFDDQFRRLFIGEGIVRKKKPKKDKDKKPKPPFVPPGYPKWHSGVGDHYGTFGGIVSAFGTGRKPGKPKKKEKEKPNALTNPGKKGGPGYANICLSKYPAHAPERYGVKPKYKQYGENLHRPMITMHFPQKYFVKNPFIEEKFGPIYVAKKEPPPKIVGDGKWIPVGPTKWQGGCHAGMFDPFPEYKTDRDPKKLAKEKQKKMKMLAEMSGGPKFLPQSLALKTMYSTSIVPYTTNISDNATNYKTYEPVYTKRLLAQT